MTQRPLSPDTQLGRLYARMKKAGRNGITQVQLQLWGLNNYCSEVMRRLRQLRFEYGIEYVTHKEPPRRGHRRFTNRYYLAEFAPHLDGKRVVV